MPFKHSFNVGAEYSNQESDKGNYNLTDPNYPGRKVQLQASIVTVKMPILGVLMPLIQTRAIHG